MRVVVATTTGFHLRRIAAELIGRDIDTRYFSTLPRFRLRREGFSETSATSLFWPLLPTSFNAINRRLPTLQHRAVEAMLARADELIARHLPPCDIFIGLSGMAVRSAEAARQRGATVIIERGSRHVISQNALVVEGGGASLSDVYMAREMGSYAAADFISLLSGHAVESFLEHGYARRSLFLNRLGVDLAMFAPSPRPPGPPKLLFVGAWSRRKGVDLLVSAMKMRPDWSLTHVGTVVDVPLPALANVTGIGHRTHRQLAEVMKDHHLLVLPSREDGFGMVMLEGLAAGLPIVASDMTGAPDIRAMITDPAHVGIHRANDAAALLDALDTAVAREAQGDPARQRLSADDRARFGWQAYGDRYLQFLRTIAARKGVTPADRSASR